MENLSNILDTSWYASYSHNAKVCGIKSYYFTTGHHYFIIACSIDNIDVYIQTINCFKTLPYKTTHDQSKKIIIELKQEIEKNKIVL
jgi:hypothetical protein